MKRMKSRDSQQHLRGNISNCPTHYFAIFHERWNAVKEQTSLRGQEFPTYIK